MNVTEVRVRLVNDKNERLKAFCTMTIDSEFVIRDIKIIDGTQGLFVAMPSRRVSDHCPACGAKNNVPAKFCNECGQRLTGGRFAEAESLGDKLHTDIAHPINKTCRARIEEAILAAYRKELESGGGSAPEAEAAGEPEPGSAGEPEAPAPPNEPES